MGFSMKFLVALTNIHGKDGTTANVHLMLKKLTNSEGKNLMDIPQRDTMPSLHEVFDFSDAKALFDLVATFISVCCGGKFNGPGLPLLMRNLLNKYEEEHGQLPSQEETSGEMNRFMDALEKARDSEIDPSTPITDALRKIVSEFQEHKPDREPPSDLPDSDLPDEFKDFGKKMGLDTQ